MTELGWPERYAHRMDALQWAYYDSLTELGNFPSLPKVYKEIYHFVWDRRRLKGLEYRQDIYEITGDDTFRLIE